MWLGRDHSVLGSAEEELSDWQRVGSMQRGVQPISMTRRGRAGLAFRTVFNRMPESVLVRVQCMTPCEPHLGLLPFKHVNCEVVCVLWLNTCEPVFVDRECSDVDVGRR